jgi:hypothetical protein
MGSVQEYRRHAEECHEQAQSVKGPEWRAALFEQMAQAWETLARLRQLQFEDE